MSAASGKTLGVMLIILLLLIAVTDFDNVAADGVPPKAKYIILMIADGWGPNHIAATNAYTGENPGYQAWTQHWVSTYASGGSYDPVRAWSEFDYVGSGATDSAAAATALYTGIKTANGRISVDAAGMGRLFAISERARVLGMAAGAVTTVQISHATPGAWGAHNVARANGYAIANEALWGNANVTGSVGDNSKYGGALGGTAIPLDVVIGGGHPYWNTSYIDMAIRNKLMDESGQANAFIFVERETGVDGGAAILASANAGTPRLAGIFGGAGGNIDYRLANGSGHHSENPTLAEMTEAALTVLSRHFDGFILLVEGGAVDWGSHSNRMDRMIGEMVGFNQAVEHVITWVEDPDNDSDWTNTLVVITGDHETGYLTAAPGVFQHQTINSVDEYKLGLEKTISGSSLRASWEDDGDGVIAIDEAVYWAWNSRSHTNTLIPLYAKGTGVEFFASYATGSDSVRGAFIDNTDVFKVMDALLPGYLDLDITHIDGNAELHWQHTDPHTAYEVRHATKPYFRGSESTISTITTLPDPGELVIYPAPEPSPHYYEVRAYAFGLSHAVSERVGHFSFTLVPGQAP